MCGRAAQVTWEAPEGWWQRVTRLILEVRVKIWAEIFL